MGILKSKVYIVLIVLLLPNFLISQNIVFDDLNFKKCLLKNDSINTDQIKTEISLQEAKSFNGTINVSKCKITSLKGIEFFISLKKLICFENRLTTLDLTKNVDLCYLDCKNNLIENLNVSNNILLEELKIYNNKISNLDLTNNVNLVQLSARNNPLKNLNISKNVNLKSLYCQNTQIENLDVSNNKLLVWLYCGDNSIKQMDVSQNLDLVEFDCSNNQIDFIDVSGNKSLVFFACSENKLKSIDLRNNLSLTTLYSKGNIGLTICVLESQLEHKWYRDINPLDEQDKLREKEFKTDCE